MTSREYKYYQSMNIILLLDICFGFKLIKAGRNAFLMQIIDYE